LDEKIKEIVERLHQLARNYADAVDSYHDGKRLTAEDSMYFVAASLITRLSERVGELERGVRALLPHLHLGHEPIVSDCLLRSRSEQMRLDAAREAKYETAVRNLRALLSKQEERR
jgi:hypothetical protein